MTSSTLCQNLWQEIAQVKLAQEQARESLDKYLILGGTASLELAASIRNFEKASLKYEELCRTSACTPDGLPLWATDYLAIKKIEAANNLDPDSLLHQIGANCINPSLRIRSLNIQLEVNLEEFGSYLSELIELEYLTLIDCPIFSCLPAELGSFKKLRIINIDTTGIEKLPGSICELPNLKELWLTYNKLLTELPIEMNRAHNLEMLSLGGCAKIQDVFTNINKLSKLTHLYLDGCTLISTITDTDIEKLTSLEVLSLHHTKVSKLPEAIEKLTKLTSLGLDFTPVTSLPRNFFKLKNLIELHLFGCPNFRLEPQMLAGLTNLKKITLSDCPHVTQEQIEQLRAIVPEDCQIIY